MLSPQLWAEYNRHEQTEPVTPLLTVPRQRGRIAGLYDRVSVTHILVVITVLAVLSGIAITTIDEPQNRNPWNDETITVTINNSAGERNFTPVTQEAIAYWNDHLAELGYTGRFVYRPEQDESADIEVRAVSAVAGDAVGRAPINDGVGSATGTSVIRIEWDGERSTQQILTHEFGHTLGLTHADHPQWGVMQTLNRSAIVWDYSNPWERRELFVYYSHSSGTTGFTTEQIDAMSSLIEFYNSGADGYLNQSLHLRTTLNRSRADIEIRKVNQLPDRYGCDHAYSSYHTVAGELRYETYGIVRIDRGANPAYYEDCVGDALSEFLIEADGGRPPPRFDTPTSLGQQ